MFLFNRDTFFLNETRLPMTKSLFILVLLIPLFAISQNVKNLDQFNKLKITTDVQVVLVQSDDYKVEYKMLKGDKDAIHIKQKGNTLIIKIKGNGWFSNSKAMVTVYVPELNEIDVSAGASLSTSETYLFEELDVSVSSGASSRLRLKGKDLDFEVSSGASIEAMGYTHSIDVDASSGGLFDGRRLEAKRGEADVSSGGLIKINCSESIEADASSGGSIKYYGDPKNKDIESGYSGVIEKG